MPYLIDGHNLIGQLPDISLSDPNDEAKLVLKLIGFAARMKTKCVVVFDQGITAGKSRMSNGVVEVVFAPQKATADKIMMARINATRDAQYWIVVSNDNEVLQCAQKRKMKTIRSAAFARELLPLRIPDKDRNNEDDDPGAAADIKLTPAEIEMWMKLFRERK